jgi:hypothetical protein
MNMLAPVPVPHLVRPDPVAVGAPRARVIRRTTMRGGVPTAKISKGASPPSTAALLAGRFESTIMAEHLMSPNDITSRAATLYKNAVARVALAHPLAILTINDLVVNGIHDAPVAQKVKDFIGSVVGSVCTTLLIENRDSEVNPDGIETLVETQFLPYVTQAEQALYTSPLTVQDADIRLAVTATIGHNPLDLDSLDVAAERYLATNGRAPMTTMSGNARSALIDALEQMPVVKAIYRGDVAADVPDSRRTAVTHTEEAFQQQHFQKYCERFLHNVTGALVKLYGMVEPGRLPPADRTKVVEVNPDEIVAGFKKDEVRINPFRADAERTNDKIRLSVLDEIPTIVHELGHHVEFALPIVVWLDLVQILQERANGRPLIDIYGNGKEIAFAAAMPAFQEIYRKEPGGEATAKYPAKIYASGDTELMSMSLEMFSQPEKARTLIRHDPILAATVLRAIRPAEFKASIQPELRALLPRGDA